MASLDATFHELVSAVDYPVFVVTARAPTGERSGCLVGFATQASIHPPRLMVFVSKANHTYGVARRADVLAVHFLTEEHREVSRLFGEETGDTTDKFAAVAWAPGPGGVPILEDCRGWVAGRVVARLDAGDHVGHLLDPVAAEVRGPRRPQLSFQETRDLDPGHPA